MRDPQLVFNLPVGFVLNADEIPVEVLGCIKYLDADAHPQYWVFNSENLSPIEAAGMSRFMEVQVADDLQTHLYLTVTQPRLAPFYVDDDDDDLDDDDDDLENA